MAKGVMLCLGWIVCFGVACGEEFETRPTDEPESSAACSAWCNKAVACPGVTQADCERQCGLQFPDEGGCAAQARAVLDCFEKEWDTTCEPPSKCAEKVTEFASCTGLGCPPENGICGADADKGLECRCAGGCGDPWQFQANCNLDGDQVDCDCFLSGPIAPVGTLATVRTTCSGSSSGESYCDEQWGCCRAKLLQNP